MLRGVNVGVFQVSSPNSTDVSDYGVYDTTTLRKDVTAVVNVTFALAQRAELRAEPADLGVAGTRTPFVTRPRGR